jgi:hypothetical protein
VPQQPQIDPQTGERIELDPATGERKSAKGVAPAPRKSQAELNHIPPGAPKGEVWAPAVARGAAIGVAEGLGVKPSTSPADVVTGSVEQFGRGLYDLGKQSYEQTPKSWSPVGRSALAAIGLPATFVENAATSVESGLKDTAKAYKGEDYEGAAQSLARTLTQIAMLKKAKDAATNDTLPQAKDRAARLSSGAGLTQGEEAVKSVLPEFDKTLKAQGKGEIKSIGEFQQAVRDTNGRLEDEYQSALKPIGKTRLNTQPVADAIANEITPNMLNTRDGQLMARELWRRSREFDQKRPWTVEELDLEREKLAKSFRDAKPSDVAADLKLKARQIADRAANKAVNDMLYSMADQAGGKPAGYFKALKQKQSILFDIADDVKAEKDSVTAGSAQKKGQLLRETVSPRSAGYPKTGVIREAAKAAAGKYLDPLDIANKKVKMAFKQPAPKAAGRTATAAAATAGSLAPRRHPSDEYADPANLQ